ncbi:MAG: DUF1846 domain-containing protein [Bacilli bacterium]|nr:DUF1846 domain-containing protein [Bacilli bacterium]
MRAQAFDMRKYVLVQRRAIEKRIKSFGDKLYLEFGGKLFDDNHASRVLPGFEPDAKLKLLLSLRKQLEVVIVVNSDDIISNKARSDIGISYQDEVKRLIDAFNDVKIYVSSVVFSFYKENDAIRNFKHFLETNNVKVYKHYEINGYPENVSLVVSEDGLGKNEYIKTTRPLVVVTAPGPGSGKMATCLSQLYHENKNHVRAGYAKYETFPVWNLPLRHPVNLAYEAATVDLNDLNVIDPFHLEAYHRMATSYNRDVASFPLLQAIFKKIYGSSPYKSPTDMGVNMVGFAIKNKKVAIKASNDEIIRRYFQTMKSNFLGKLPDSAVEKARIIMSEAKLSVDDRKCVKPCNERAAQTGVPCMALEKGNKIITAKRSQLLGAPAALLLNTLKSFANIEDKQLILSRRVIEPVTDLKVNILRNHNPRIHAEEVLIALALQADTNPLAEAVLKQVPKLRGLQAHSSVILPVVDMKTFRKLGMNVTEEAKSYAGKIFTK